MAPKLRTNQQVSLAFDWLAEGIERETLPMYRSTMVKPLVLHVLDAESTGDDKSDLRRLRDSMPDAFDKMQAGKVERVAEAAMVQAHLIGETAATPENVPRVGEGEEGEP